MNASWPVVRLGDVLDHCKEFIQIDDGVEYVRPRVQLHAQGIVLRDRAYGSEIKTKRQQICRAGQFLVAEIDAKAGGFGLVPNELGNAIVSSHYFLYDLVAEIIVPDFFRWFIRTSAFKSQVTAQGSTNYAAIRPHDVLGYSIPLPPLEEQQRIVARIEKVATRVESVRRLQEEIRCSTELICRGLLQSEAHPRMLVSEILELRAPDVSVVADEDYQFAGVYSFGRGVFVGGRKRGMEFAYPKLTRLEAGNFVYPKLMAWEGALGVVPEECDGMVVSTEFPVFRVKRDVVCPEILDVYFKNPEIWPSLSGSSPGTNVRRRRLNPSDFLRLCIPVPSKSVQTSIADIRYRQRRMSMIANGGDSIDALLPSFLDRAFRGEI